MPNKIQDFTSGLKVKVNSDGTVIFGNKTWRFLTTAITANVTTTTLGAGTFGMTTHATGRDKIFVSDGSKWQAGGAGGGSFSDEIPTGDVDGINDEFVFVGTPFAVFRNGVKYDSTDYSVAGTTVTLDEAPPSGVITGLTQ
jgi:hypothetical protein